MENGGRSLKITKQYGLAEGGKGRATTGEGKALEDGGNLNRKTQGRALTTEGLVGCERNQTNAQRRRQRISKSCTGSTSS